LTFQDFLFMLSRRENKKGWVEMKNGLVVNKQPKKTFELAQTHSNTLDRNGRSENTRQSEHLQQDQTSITATNDRQSRFWLLNLRDNLACSGWNQITVPSSQDLVLSLLVCFFRKQKKRSSSTSYYDEIFKKT
jgi:hypothetical protein